MADEGTERAPDQASRQGVVAGLRSTWAGLPPNRRLLIAGAGAVVLALLMWLALGGARGEEWRPVARAMLPEDMDAAVKAFEAQNIRHRLEDHGTITVPASEIHQARLLLAVGTMPSGRSVGFELFDEAEMGRSAFSEKVNYHRALEGELARTIRHIDGIERVRVHLVIPARRVFRELDTQASASVVVALRSGFELNPRQAHAIRQLVAGGVERLEPNQVAIVDQFGSMVARPESGGMLGGAGFEHQTELERQLEQRVVHLLEPVVGGGKVRAQVALKMDYAHVVETRETYDPDGQVVRSEREQTERSESTSPEPGGPPGTATNLPARAGAALAAAQGARTVKERADTIRNFDIDKSVVRRESPMPRVERLSVAVLVDQGVDAQGNPRARTAAELDSYRDLISGAVGLDPGRGDQLQVVSVPFAAPYVFDEPVVVEPPAPVAAPGPLDNPLVLAAIIGGVVLLLVILVLLWLWLRRRKRRREAAASPSGLDLVIGDGDEPERDTDRSRRRIEELRERAVALAEEDLRRLAVVFERWFDEDRQIEQRSGAAPLPQPREEAA